MHLLCKWELMLTATLAYHPDSCICLASSIKLSGSFFVVLPTGAQFCLYTMQHSSAARSRLLAAAGQPLEDTTVTLDRVAGEAPLLESLVEATNALFPELDAQINVEIVTFFTDQGALSRANILSMLRACDGYAVLDRAQKVAPPMSLLALAALEGLVKSAGTPVWKSGAGQSSAQEPLPKQMPLVDENAPVDFGKIRPFLDEAQMGEPTESGIPRAGMFDAAVAAGTKHTIPYRDAINFGEFPKGWTDRPLAHWMQDVTRRYWSLCITGVAGPGDCYNRLSQVAAVALDHRYSSDVAARAAVRYDAEMYNKVCNTALKARSGPEVRDFLRHSCEEFNETVAKRLLEEEAMPSAAVRSRGNPSSQALGPATSALREAMERGGKICFLYGLGKCDKTETVCEKVHVCIYCGGNTKGCWIKNHGSVLKRHLSSLLSEGSKAGSGKGWPSGGSRSWQQSSRGRSRSPRDRQHWESDRSGSGDYGTKPKKDY